MADTILTTDEKIQSVTREISRLTTRDAELASQLNLLVQQLQAAMASNRSAEGINLSIVIDKIQAERAGDKVELESLKKALVSLQAQRQIEMEADQARTLQIRANAELTAAQSKLSPEQIFALKSEQQRQEAELAAKASESAAKKEAEKSKSNKVYIIWGIVGVVIIIGGIIIYKVVNSTQKA